MILRLWRQLTSRRIDSVSDRWLGDQQRKSSRIEFEGVAIQFPIQKLMNDSAKLNRVRLRRRA